MPHASLGIGFGLAFLDAALAELFVENGDLLAGGTQASLRLRDTGAGLIFARMNLRVVEDGNHIANNRPWRWRALSADWMAQQLGLPRQ